jgi:hypothetical protein
VSEPAPYDDDRMVKFGEMVKAMQYLTDEVTNLRYRLLQYESGIQPSLCEKPKRKRKSNS